MRSDADEKLRYREECRALQIKLNEARSKHVIIQGIPEREHRHIVTALERELESLRLKLTAQSELHTSALAKESERATLAEDVARAKVDDRPEIERLQDRVVELTKQRDQWAGLVKGMRAKADEQIAKARIEMTELQNRLRRFEQCR